MTPCVAIHGSGHKYTLHDYNYMDMATWPASHNAAHTQTQASMDMVHGPCRGRGVASIQNNSFVYVYTRQRTAAAYCCTLALILNKSYEIEIERTNINNGLLHCTLHCCAARRTPNDAKSQKRRATTTAAGPAGAATASHTTHTHTYETCALCV